MSTTAAPGKYEVLGKLAETTTSELFVARTDQAGPQRFVVVKRLRRDIARDLARVKAFLDRAKLVSHIEHPNIAQVFDCGKLGGSYFATMELVDGETIAAMIEHSRQSKIPIPVRVVLTLAAGAAAGLHHAHERRASDGKLLGVVHGNLGPTSVMVTRDGIVKLVGFARIPETRDVAYSSPELRDGRPIDRRSDLFSLGLVLWELLTLEPLPRDDDAVAAPPSSKRYELPKELDAMVAKLLAKDPGERYATAGELLAAIEALAARLELTLSTTDLARVMRLWYGEPAGPNGEPLASITVESEAVPADLVAPASPIDAMLEQVRSNAAAIRRLVAASTTAATTRRHRSTAVPLGEPATGDLRESFEQIRDRILANARPKKDTSKPEDTPAPARKKPETLNPTNQYSYITNVKGKAAEPLRSVTGTPPLGAPSETAGVATVAKLELAAVPMRIEEKVRATDREKLVVDVAPEPAKPVAANDEIRAEEPAKVEVAAEPAKVEVAAEPAKVEVAAEPAKVEVAAEPAKVEAKPADDSKPEAAEPAEPKADAEKAEKTEKTEKIDRPGKAAKAAKAADADEAADSDDEAKPGAEPADDEDTAPPVRAPWLVPVLAAGVAIAAIGIVLVLHGGNKHTAAAPSPPPPPVHADARVQVAVAPDAPAVAPPDAAVAAVVIDAAVVVAAPPDAAQVAAAPPDARIAPADAAQVAAVAPDAAGPRHHHHEDTPPAGGEPEPPKPAKDERTIEQLFDAGEFGKANKDCSTTTQFNTARLIDCALAACHVKDTALAKRWSHAIDSASRVQVAAQCHDLGVDLDAP